MSSLSNFSYIEIAIAHRDEMSIEDELLDLKSEGSGGPWTLELVEALRRIDDLKYRGNYDIERAKLLALMRDPVREAEWDVNREWLNKPETQRFAKDLSNFAAGLRSEDPAQKARFEAAAEKYAIRDKMPYESATIFGVAERVKTGKRGRPKVSPPWRNENVLLEEMRNLCFDGTSVPDAARAVAAKEGLDRGSRSNDLAKLYRRKMKLRE